MTTLYRLSQVPICDIELVTTMWQWEKSSLYSYNDDFWIFSDDFVLSQKAKFLVVLMAQRPITCSFGLMPNRKSSQIGAWTLWNSLWLVWCNPRSKVISLVHVKLKLDCMRQQLHAQAIQMEGSKGKTIGWSLETKLVVGVIYFLFIGQHY